MSLDQPSLETPRLLLRPPRMEDFEGWAKLMADPQAAQFIGGAQPREMAWRTFMVMAGSWSLQGYAMFSVIEKSTRRWVGRVGPWMPPGWPGPEVGWAVARDSWNRGYATEAASAATDWAFENLGWAEVIHVIAPDNQASQAVARKLGSYNRGSGSLPAPLQDARVDIWGQTRSEWLARS